VGSGNGGAEMKPYGIERDWNQIEAWSSGYRKNLEGKGGDRHSFRHGSAACRSAKRVPKKKFRAAVKRELRAEY
jgi:hypothetical protein